MEKSSGNYSSKKIEQFQLFEKAFVLLKKLLKNGKKKSLKFYFQKLKTTQVNLNQVNSKMYNVSSIVEKQAHHQEVRAFLKMKSQYQIEKMKKIDFLFSSISKIILRKRADGFIALQRCKNDFEILEKLFSREGKKGGKSWKKQLARIMAVEDFEVGAKVEKILASDNKNQLRAVMLYHILSKIFK